MPPPGFTVKCRAMVSNVFQADLMTITMMMYLTLILATIPVTDHKDGGLALLM